MSVPESRREYSPPAVKTVFPDVLSASRATDIPAFYAREFMESLRRGYREWTNPFNNKQKRIVSFRDAAAIVFWSKNPAPLMPHLSEIEDLGKNFYFQFTLNAYDDDGLEPGTPDLESRIDAFGKLARICPVVWRYDPVVLGGELTVKTHIERLRALLERLGDKTEKLVFSFVDLYRGVSGRLRKVNPSLRPPVPDEIRQFAEELVAARDRIAPGLALAACAEGKADFGELGIAKNSCIDPALINRICHREIYKPLVRKRSPKQASLQDPGPGDAPAGPVFAKDKGQRDACGCAPSKDIGSYRNQPCRHGCVYCYAARAE